MPTTLRTQEIASLFQRYLINNDKSLIENLSLEELEAADTDLGWRDKDSSWRMAIQKRVVELKQEERDKIMRQEQEARNIKAEKKHCQNLWLGRLGILTTIIIALLGWFYFK